MDHSAYVIKDQISSRLFSDYLSHLISAHSHFYLVVFVLWPARCTLCSVSAFAQDYTFISICQHLHRISTRKILCTASPFVYTQRHVIVTVLSCNLLIDISRIPHSHLVSLSNISILFRSSFYCQLFLDYFSSSCSIYHVVVIVSFLDCNIDLVSVFSRFEFTDMSRRLQAC